MMTKEDLQQLSDLIDARLDAKLAPINQRLDRVDQRLDRIECDISYIKEDAAITREAANSLCEWAENVAAITNAPTFPIKHKA